MTLRLRSGRARAGWIVAGGIGLIALALLQSHRLGDSPAYLNLDEAHFGNHAYSLATTGRDLNGDRLPLFISLEDPLGDRPVLPWGTTWYHPYGFYLIASSLLVLPLNEWSIRFPIAMIGVLDVALMFFVARRWYDSRLAGVIAAAVLAMTPAHFIISRLAMDYLLPLPFALAWLYALTHVMRSPSRRAAMVTGLVLGAGCYSFVSSWMLMPIFLAVTAAVIAFELRARELLLPLIAGFAIAMLPLVLWLLAHPGMPGNVIAQYQVGGRSTSLRSAIRTYWSYFNPSFLFVNGGASRLISTGQIGVWPAGIGILIAMAILNVVRGQRGSRAAIVIAGVLIAVIPAALKGEPFAIQRAILMLPFGALLAAGALAQPESRGVIASVIIALACVSIPYQFAGFISDYFDGYRRRSAVVIDPTSFRETAQVLVTAGDAPVIAIPAPLYDVSAKWRFYAAEFGRADLLQRTRYYSGNVSELEDLPAGALVVVASTSLPSGSEWHTVAAPKDINGDTPLQVIRR